jgi:hypothetical protein
LEQLIFVIMPSGFSNSTPSDLHAPPVPERNRRRSAPERTATQRVALQLPDRHVAWLNAIARTRQTTVASVISSLLDVCKTASQTAVSPSAAAPEVETTAQEQTGATSSEDSLSALERLRKIKSGQQRASNRRSSSRPSPEGDGAAGNEASERPADGRTLLETVSLTLSDPPPSASSTEDASGTQVSFFEYVTGKEVG